ncbi:MAG: hypothetical protein LBG58_04520, partial [Planctomycetaceae bacterium]|nr:hypothetical protein [Planctomycetaceae bacterium]
KDISNVAVCAVYSPYTRKNNRIIIFTMLFRWYGVIQIKTLIPYRYNAKPTVRLENIPLGCKKLH